jgi:hypothetical protein
MLPKDHDNAREISLPDKNDASVIFIAAQYFLDAGQKESAASLNSRDTALFWQAHLKASAAGRGPPQAGIRTGM